MFMYKIVTIGTLKKLQHLAPSGRLYPYVHTKFHQILHNPIKSYEPWYGNYRTPCVFSRS